ncbi:MAG: hypothetical protein B5M56_08305 [Desulfococcus sp. 4484_241]|nr:MAG: hypothetical protein B5M56_08305 [Desulfococcus sp. 4484_241]
MGKKSLFQPTADDNETGNLQSQDEGKSSISSDASSGASSDNKNGVAACRTSANGKDSVSGTAPNIHESPATRIMTQPGGTSGDGGPDPMTRMIAAGVGCAAFLILILLVASAMNAGRYYVKESRGAVEIWKGDFSPEGRDRIMVLQGTRWDRDKKDYYDKNEVLDFASCFYLQKALGLVDVSDIRDYDRIQYYLEKAIAVNRDAGNSDAVSVLKTVAKYMQEAAILDTGESDTAPVVAKKITEAKHALAALLAKGRHRDQQK